MAKLLFVLLLLLVAFADAQNGKRPSGRSRPRPKPKSTTTTTTSTSTAVTTTSLAPQPTTTLKNDVFADTWLRLFLQYSYPARKNAAEICSDKSLSVQQSKVCRQHAELANAFVNAARSAIQQCQLLFRNQRWNCSVDRETVFGNLLRYNTRETGFIYAIASASLTVAVTKACSSGEMHSCYCDRSENGILNEEAIVKKPTGLEARTQNTYIQHGCSDNVQYAISVSRNFLDGHEEALARRVAEAQPLRVAMNLHNNEQGRRSTKLAMRIECKCIGISGSCASKTCARVLPRFDELALALKQRYDTSKKVREPRLGGKLLNRKLFRGKNVSTSLVHLEDSYNFCESDPARGSLGTRGRLCNSTATDESNCKHLCCGRGYKTYKYTKLIDCNCIFKFCCKIECQKCEVKVTENRCQ